MTHHDLETTHDTKDWEAWLDLSATPPTARPQALTRHLIHGGHLIAPHTWPIDPTPRIYVAFGDTSPLYVGQTSHPLAIRVRKHFGHQRSHLQQRKAGTWRFIVAATFVDHRPGELDQLERAAAEWLLPLRHRGNSRHPQPQTARTGLA